jgi:hypothetical protein
MDLDLKTLELKDTEIFKVKNILYTNIGSLRYIEGVGIDLSYIIGDINIGIRSFITYLSQQLLGQGVSVNSINEMPIENFTKRLVINIKKGK